MRINRLAAVATILTAIVSAPFPARATTYTWTGGDGSSNSWYFAGNWDGTIVPSDEPPSDYVFAADGWNAVQTTITIDGANRCPDVQSLTFRGNVGIPLTVQIGPGNSLYLDPSSSGATTISVAQTGVTQTIAGSSRALIQLADNQQWSVDGALAVSAVIWDDGESPSPGFVKTGAGTLTLSGANSFSGPITINQGVISVSTVADKGQVCNLGRGDLTLNGGTLLYTGTAANVSTSRGFALGAGGGTVDVQNAATSLTFTGAVTGGQAGLTKTGSGRLVLTGVSTYTGLTTVIAGGTLELGVNAEATVLAGGADIQNSGTSVAALVFDYSGSSAEASLLASIRSDLQSGTIKDTLAGTLSSGGHVGLGYIDNGSSSITVEPMLLGDANHDGTVNASDLASLGANWKHTSSGWGAGDFNYDGTVNASDLAILGANWKKTWSPTLPSDIVGLPGIGSSVTPVPEPGSFILLASAALALGGQAWVRRRG